MRHKANQEPTSSGHGNPISSGGINIEPMPEPHIDSSQQHHAKFTIAGFVIGAVGCVWIAISLVVFESRGPAAPYYLVGAGFVLSVLALIRRKGNLRYAKWGMAIGPPDGNRLRARYCWALSDVDD